MSLSANGGAAIAAATIGGILYDRTERIIEQQLRAALAGQTAYVTPAQINTFVTAAMAQMRGTIRAPGIVTSGRFVTAMKNLHNSLVDFITPNVLRSQVFGRSGPELNAHSAYWRTILKSMTNRCIDRASADGNAISAMTCVTNSVMPAASSPLQTNLGTAVIFEMSRKSLEPMVSSANREHFRACRTKEYLQCMNITTNAAPTNCSAATYPVTARGNLEACATRSLRNGIMEVAPITINRTIREMAPASEAERISTLAVSTLRNCLPGAANERAITGCFDNTVLAAGREIVEAKVLAELAVQEAFSTSAERQRVAGLALTAFNACARRAGHDANGILDISNCEGVVTNAVSKEVMLETFERQDPLALETGRAALDRCWPRAGSNASPNACMRSSIISFAAASARRQVTEKVPAGLLITSPSFVDANITSLAACLGNELPSDIMAARNLETRIDSCAQALTLNVAKSIARFEVSNTLRDQMSPEALEELLVREVDGVFMTCLGARPADADLTRCEGNLRHDVGVAAGSLLIPAAINDYANKSGGAAALGISNEELASLNQSLVTRNTTCLGENRARIAEALDECFRGTITQAVGDIAVLSVRRELEAVRPLSPNLNVSAQETRARELIQACLAEGVAPAAALADTLARIEPCGERVTSEMRRAVLSEVIVLTREPIDAIFANYQACLGRRGNNNCDVALAREVNVFMLPFKNKLERPAADCDCLPQATIGIQLDVIQMATAAMISLIQESRGRLPEARAEVHALISQFSELAGGNNVAQTREALIADDSSDPLLQTLVRSLLREALRGVPADSGITPAVKAQLIDENLIREIFNSGVLRDIKTSAATILENVSAGADTLQLDSKELQMAVARTFLGSQRVMGIIMQGQINNEINRRGPLVRWIAPLAAGVMGMDLNWENARRRPAAREAQDWVLDQVILPIIDGTLSPEEAKVRQREAAQKVQAALRRR